MARTPVLLITGAGGEIGHGLIHRLSEEGGHNLVALDIHEIDPSLGGLCLEAITGSITDTALLDSLAERYEIAGIIHLAAMLSSSGERNPERAHEVNVQGTLNLLHLAAASAARQERNVPFLFPSSIAVYGLESVAAKEAAGRVKEEEHLEPITMYGVNKLACEHLGRYFSTHYRMLAADRSPWRVDFRSLRFPGLISADTVPSGGTSDFAPEMLHAAARGEHYACFARPDTRIPFMAMPDALDAILTLMRAPEASLTRRVYNVGGFAPTAQEVYDRTLRSFPSASVSWEVDARRQGILDSWPADVDDDRARADWGYAPRFDFERAFEEYLMPAITRRYAEA